MIPVGVISQPCASIFPTLVQQSRMFTQIPADFRTEALPRESHEGGVQGDGQQHVRDGDRRHGQDSHEVGDAPVIGDDGSDGQDYHDDDGCK